MKFLKKVSCSLLLMHSRIIRQIVRYRLIAVSKVSRSKWSVHHFHRRLQSMFRGTILGGQWKCILNIWYILLEEL